MTPIDRDVILPDLQHKTIILFLEGIIAKGPPFFCFGMGILEDGIHQIFLLLINAASKVKWYFQSWNLNCSFFCAKWAPPTSNANVKGYLLPSFSSWHLAAGLLVQAAAKATLCQGSLNDLKVFRKKQGRDCAKKGSNLFLLTRSLVWCTQALCFQ